MLLRHRSGTRGIALGRISFCSGGKTRGQNGHRGSTVQAGGAEDSRCRQLECRACWSKREQVGREPPSTYRRSIVRRGGPGQWPGATVELRVRPLINVEGCDFYPILRRGGRADL